MKQAVSYVVWFALAAVMFEGWSARAQQSNVGNISGTVHDSSGAVIPNAEVVATNETTNLRQSTVSTSDGLYNINLLPVGMYTVSATRAGFRQEFLLLAVSGLFW